MRIKNLAPAPAFVALIIVLQFGNSASGQVGRSQGLINPDLAGEKELLALPHMNAALVKQIIERRPFLRPADLHALLAPSLKQEQLRELYGKMFVQINLNNASEDEILMIPGVGKRML